MKIKALFFALVCAFFLAMLSIPTTAEAKNFRYTKDKMHPGNIRVVNGKCSNGRGFFVQKNPGAAWYFQSYGGSNQINAAQDYARRHGGGNPDRMAELFCSRP